MKAKTQNRHATVSVRVGARRANIDRKLAPLIRELWKAGIETTMSCEETEPGIAWIEFADVDNLATFLDTVTKYEPGNDTLYNRITHMFTGPLSAPVWQYTVFPCDMALSVNEKSHRGVPSFFFSASVYFPQSDLAILVQRMREAASTSTACR
ncbi:MAG: hypothetical protein HY040_21880 [Planctomycetes bacterium]|nr:hypothetical protein [Planctomycetota bacterium]